MSKAHKIAQNAIGQERLRVISGQVASLLSECGECFADAPEIRNQLREVESLAYEAARFLRKKQEENAK